MAMPASTNASSSAVESIYHFDAGTIVTSLFLTFTTIAVALRVFVRTRLLSAFGPDDAILIAAQLSFIATAILTFVGVYCEKVFVDTGAWVITKSSLIEVIRAHNGVYVLTMTLVKLSLAVSYIKLIAFNSKWPRIAIISLSTLSSAIGIAYLTFTFSSCGMPIGSTGLNALETKVGWCNNEQAYVSFSLSWSFINTITDFVFVGLAIPALQSIPMIRSAQTVSIVLVCLGCVGGIFSCARIAVQVDVVNILDASVMLATWSNVEAGICILAVSIAALRPLLQPSERKNRTKAGFSRRAGPMIPLPAFEPGGTNSSFSRSKSEVTEITELEYGKSFDQSGVVVTKTWGTESHATRWQ